MAPVKTYDQQVFPIRIDGPGAFVDIIEEKEKKIRAKESQQVN